MTRTRHDDHVRPQSWCPACRWERMSPVQQAAYRAERRRAARESWRSKHPERAALRDLLTTGVTPGPCDRCGRTDDTVAMIDYEAVRITGWRCPACWRAAQDEWRSKHRAAA